MATHLQKTSSEDIFRQYTNAFILPKSHEQTWPQNFPSELKFKRNTPSKQLEAKIDQVIQNIFNEYKQTNITAPELISFVTNLDLYLKNAQQYKPFEIQRIWNHTMITLYKDNLQFSPWLGLEVLLSRKTESMASTEVRALEACLSVLVSEFYSIKNYLYSFYFSYIGGLLGVKIDALGGKTQNAEFLSLDWANIPLQSPEAVTLAADLQKASQASTVYRKLPELYEDFPELNDECRRVLEICALDFTWACVGEVETMFDEPIRYRSLYACPSKGYGLHPAVKNSIESISSYWLSIKITGPLQLKNSSREKGVYKAKERQPLLKALLTDLTENVSLYKKDLDKLHSLYSRGFEAYCRASQQLHGFIPNDFIFPSPASFKKESLFVIDINELDTIPFSIEKLIPFAGMSWELRKKSILNLAFKKEEDLDYVLKEILSNKPSLNTRPVKEPDMQSVAQSFLPQELLKKKNLPRAKTPPHHSKKKLVQAITRLSISAPSSLASQLDDFPNPDPQPCPPSTLSIPPTESCTMAAASLPMEKESSENISPPTLEPFLQETPNILPPTLQLSSPQLTAANSPSLPKKHPRPKTPPQSTALKVLREITPSIWVSQNCLQGTESEICAELKISQIIHPRITENSYKLRELKHSREPISQSLRNHVYPVFIAAIIQRNTPVTPHFSVERTMYDDSHSCVGSITDYSHKADPSLVVFTEGFLAKPFKQWDTGTLFHHFFYELSSANIIRQKRRTGAFHEASSIEDVLDSEHAALVKSKISHRPFRVTFTKKSCIVDDLKNGLLYKMVFSKNLTLTVPPCASTT